MNLAVMDVLSPPKAVAGMTVLDKQAFEKAVTIPGIVVDRRKCSECLNTFKGQLLRSCPLEGIHNIQDTEDKDKKVCCGCVCLRHNVSGFVIQWVWPCLCLL